MSPTDLIGWYTKTVRKMIISFHYSSIILLILFFISSFDRTYAPYTPCCDGCIGCYQPIDENSQEVKVAQLRFLLRYVPIE